MTLIRHWWGTDPRGLTYAATALLAPIVFVLVFAVAMAVLA